MRIRKFLFILNADLLNLSFSRPGNSKKGKTFQGEQAPAKGYVNIYFGDILYDTIF